MTVRTAPAGAAYSRTNITAATNLGATTASDRRVLMSVQVVVTAAAASSILDDTSTTPAAGNTVLTIPASTTQGTIYNWPAGYPLNTGLSIVPGSGVTLAVVWQ